MIAVGGKGAILIKGDVILIDKRGVLVRGVIVVGGKDAISVGGDVVLINKGCINGWGKM